MERKMELNDPKKIYEIVNQQLSKFDQFDSSEVENEIFESTKETVLRTINREKEELIFKVNDLEEKSEWDVFSIAFYGETNAGKSTLIETLRILLNEPTKVKDRAMYSEFSNDLKEINIGIKEKDAKVKGAKKQFDASVADVNDNIEFNELEINALNETIEDFDNEIQINKAIITQKASESLKLMFLSLFKKLPENVLILEANKNKKAAQQIITNLKSNIEAAKKDIGQKEQKYKDSVRSLEKELLELKTQAQELENKADPFSDGKIIGTGESDYTRKVEEYQFEMNGQKFKILDLPGIEGKESIVQDEIMNALKRSHAVFYMNGKPTPPQSGDDRQEGTIEKIKNQLADQSEIYFVYNKRIQNPRGFDQTLISDEEEHTLAETDDLLRKKLGTYYEGHKVLSALPGFLAVANLTASDRNYKIQQKFREKISEEEILALSGVEKFGDFLQTTLIQNVQAKIKAANYNKIQVALDQLRIDLLETQKNMMISKNKMSQIEQSTASQIDSLVMELKSSLDQVSHQVVDKFAHDLRLSIYADIDTDLSNDEFKYLMEQKINESEEIVKSDIILKMSGAVDQFNDETQTVVSQFQEYATNIAVGFDGGGMLDLTNAFTFDPKSKQSPLGMLMDIGPNIAGLVMVLLESTNPVGWALIVVGLVFKLFKMIRGLFDKNYKKAQQKNAADAKISDLSAEIRNNLQTSIEEINSQVESSMEEIKEKTIAVVNQFRLMDITFKDVIERISTIEKALKNETI